MMSQHPDHPDIDGAIFWQDRNVNVNVMYSVMMHWLMHWHCTSFCLDFETSSRPPGLSLITVVLCFLSQLLADSASALAPFKFQWLYLFIRRHANAGIFIHVLNDIQ